MTDNVVKTYTFVRFHELEQNMEQPPKVDKSAPTEILLHLFKFRIVRLQVRAGEWY